MLSHYGVPALCPTLKHHRWPLVLQGLDTGGSLNLTGSDSHRLSITHRTGAHLIFSIIPDARPKNNRFFPTPLPHFIFRLAFSQKMVYNMLPESPPPKIPIPA